MDRIKAIWRQLEESNYSIPGLLKLRYSDTSNCDVYLGIKYPEVHRTFIIKVPFDVGKTFKFKYEFRGLKFDKVYDPDDSKFVLLNLVLVDNQFKDVFDTLAADLVGAILNESDCKVVLKNYTNRLIKWQSLFERFNQQGLSAEAQRGLYGELFFMRKFLNANSDFANILISWVGPEKQVRDFQYGRWGVEVKTTSGNNHQKINISSERQLDTTNLDHLYLYHISLDGMQQSGETLNELVDTISELLSINLVAYNQFRNKLTYAGYFEMHRNFYTDIGYFVRQDIYYIVNGLFPRIEESDIRQGVGDVKYSIIVTQLNEHTVSENEVLNTLIFT